MTPVVVFHIDVGDRPFMTLFTRGRAVTMNDFREATTRKSLLEEQRSSTRIPTVAL